MAKSRKPKKSKVRIQVIYDKSVKVFKEKYLSPKGELLIKSAKTKKQKDEILVKYGKNRYTRNKDLKPIYSIIHRL